MIKIGEENMRGETELMGRVMDVLNPIVAKNFGPNINRRTIENIQKAGFEIIKEEFLISTVFRLILAKPKTGNLTINYLGNTINQKK